MLGEAAVWVCGRAGREKKAGAAGGPAHLGLVCPLPGVGHRLCIRRASKSLSRSGVGSGWSFREKSGVAAWRVSETGVSLGARGRVGQRGQQFR